MSPVASHNAAPKRHRAPKGGAGGARLADAFDSVASMPALAESRRRVLSLSTADSPSSNELTDAVESDTGLAVAVMRAANNGGGPSGRVAGVREALEALSPGDLREIADALETYDPFDGGRRAAAQWERFRRHAVATRHAADLIADEARVGRRDELAIAALLHDVGRLVLVRLYGDELGEELNGESPDERAHRERRDFGIDHALVGAVLARRWGLTPGVAAAIERHHSADAEDHAAVIRLADLVVHHAAGDQVPPEALVSGAERLGLDEDMLRGLLYEFPHAGSSRPRISEPCPLSNREIDALRGLSEGKVYKQIAQELKLSVSTVRTHLHNVYRKIGAVDRAQAVLTARERGWI